MCEHDVIQDILNTNTIIDLSTRLLVYRYARSDQIASDSILFDFAAPIIVLYLTRLWHINNNVYSHSPQTLSQPSTRQGYSNFIFAPLRSDRAKSRSPMTMFSPTSGRSHRSCRYPPLRSDCHWETLIAVATATATHILRGRRDAARTREFFSRFGFSVLFDLFLCHATQKLTHKSTERRENTDFVLRDARKETTRVRVVSANVMFIRVDIHTFSRASTTYSAVGSPNKHNDERNWTESRERRGGWFRLPPPARR